MQQHLYGDAAGGWMLVRFPDDQAPPEQLGGFDHLGPVTEVMQGAAEFLERRGKPRVPSLSHLIGLSHGGTEKVLTRGTMPTLPDHRWAKLVRFMHGPDAVEIPVAQRGRPPGTLADTTVVAESNRRRAAATEPRAAAVEAARAALRVCKPQHREVLQARVDYPDDSLAELAPRLGLRKNALQGRLRRALESVAAQEPGEPGG